MIRSISFFAVVLAMLVLCPCASSQSPVPAPIERTGFTRTTSYDSLQGFLKGLTSSPNIQVEQLTTTRMGRIVSVAKISSSQKFGADPGKLRVLLFAQQHGDEPAGKEALTLLLAKLASRQRLDWLNHLDLLIVPQMNPDGAELRQRRTSDSIDLNRNHVLLTSPETKALHDLFHEWKPEVTLDAHEYSSSKSWRDSGLIKTADVQLGMLTHPNTPATIRALQHEKIYPFVASTVQGRGYKFQEYIVGDPSSRIRHSTTEINDGRQSFGILNTLSFIQEGRKWRGLEDSIGRRAQSQLASMEGLLEYCSMHAREIQTLVASERSNLTTMQEQPVVLRMEHVSGQARDVIPVFNTRTNKDTIWTVTPYHSVVRSLVQTKMPSFYLVPRQYGSIVELLRRHHTILEEIATEKSMKVEVTTVDSVGTEEIEETPMPLLHVRRSESKVTVRPGDVIVSTGQWQSVLIAIILESQSVWGLSSYADFESVLRKPGTYPILRVIR